MKSERRIKNGSWEIVPPFLISPSDEIDQNNPFIRKKVALEITTRKCKICGTGFTLHGEYDKDNPSHDLCDECILLAPFIDQNYPDKTNQIDQNELDAAPQEFMEPGEELAE